MTLQEILSLLDNVKKNGNQYTARCPAHKDKENSLSVSEKSDKIVLHCHTKVCTVNDICAALSIELKDLFSEPKQSKAANNFQSKKIVAVYDYADEHGEILYQNVRYEPKDFRQRKPNGRGDGFNYSLNGTRRVPYRLPELIKAVGRGADVWLCEGEKDADNLRTLGFAATSFKNWKSEFNAFLKSSHICLILDHDKAGLKQANDACELLSDNVASLKTLDLFQDEFLPEKHGKDFSDWFENEKQNGLSNEEIAEKLCILNDNAIVWQPTDANDADGADAEDFEETEIKPFPVPNEKCFHGLTGEYVRMIEPQTEASSAALLVQFLTYFGNIVGRSAFYQVEADKHFTNLFCVLVGDTASGRKGTSFGRVKEIFKGEDEAHEKDCIVSGLASGEGLLYQIRDAVYEEKTDKKTKKVETVCTDNGVSDKRLLIVEGEFAQVLRVQGREGNTLSAFLRNLWDNGTARNLTKNSPLRTTDAHVSIIGHITKTELLNCLDEVESANGYANRFLWFAVRRSKFLPFGASEIDSYELANFQRKLSERIKSANTVKRMIFTTEARNFFASVYERLETSRYGFLAKITQRATAYVCRLSCIFALLDGKDEIEREHLEAALAVWQYAEDSARYIFGGRIGDKNAEIILDALRESENGLSRTEIRDLFDRHISKERLDSALQSLLENGLAKYEKVETKGKAKEVWLACVFSVFSVLSSENLSGEKSFNAKNAKNAIERKDSANCKNCGLELELTEDETTLFCPFGCGSQKNVSRGEEK
ncbi:MAG: DUF3987 domain-containing protein [Acidobacteria bacterium]|jgi:predicted RNA-binding Zn-ribbon protein involved in translation (DUF1610 family)|nr:DUF3987 domain-containing protein [Acidobacteriota bacterium]